VLPSIFAHSVRSRITASSTLVLRLPRTRKQIQVHVQSGPDVQGLADGSSGRVAPAHQPGPSRGRRPRSARMGNQ
jgi:hypothetical protein